MLPTLKSDSLSPSPEDSDENHRVFSDLHPIKKNRSKISRSIEIVEENEERKVRRIMRKDVERQRRREMAALFSSLRSLLPLEYIRGNRSVSDQMNEVVNYIKNTENNIQALRKRRDGLMEPYDSSTSDNESITSTDRNDDTPSSFQVNVNSCGGGIEILISSGLRNGNGFPLSIILRELVTIGVNVVSSISTRTDHQFIHIVRSEAEDMESIDLAALQQRLEDVLISGCL